MPAGRFTARSAIEGALAAIERVRALNAATAVPADRAFARAERIDAAVAAGRDPGPLAGVPFAAKNLFDVEGRVTRAGSRATDLAGPAGEDAAAIASLERAGAILVALTNMDELAYGFSGENAHDGDTRNPRDPSRSAGGSSSGSAALVAAGAVPFAIGTDTNGSIRVPAALCGVFGLKPTYGRLSRRGAYPFVASLDHVGPLAASVQNLAAAYDAMLGLDPRDPVSAGRAVEPVGPLRATDDGGCRAALLRGYFADGLTDDVAEAVATAAAMLDARCEVVLERAAAGRAAAFVITTCEAGHLHRRVLAERPELFGPLVRERLFAGALAPAGWYLAAQKMRRLVSEELASLFERHDLLIAPATPFPAPVLGTDTVEIGGQAQPARSAVGMFTQALTLTGVPIAVAPRRGAHGLPVGVQLIAPPWREDIALRAAFRLEAAGFSDHLNLTPPAKR